MLKHWFWVFCLVFFIVTSAVASKNIGSNIIVYNYDIIPIKSTYNKYSEKLNTLTKIELDWIKQNPIVFLGSDYKWAPLDFMDENNVHSGISSSYAKLIEQKTGLKLKITMDIWDKVLSKMKKGNLDGLVCIVKTEDREKYLNFSKPYLDIPTVIIVRNDNDEILSIDDLNGRIVAINKSSYLHDWLTSRYPEIKLHLTTSNEASIEAVSYGEADAYIGNLAVSSFTIRQMLLTNLKVVKKLSNMITKVSIGIDKENLILFRIIEKALKSITVEEKQAILSEWYMETVEDKVTLTEKERVWINEHPIIQIAGDPEWSPLSSFNTQGEYIGIIPDFLKAIERYSDLKFDIIRTQSWKQTFGMMKDGQLDLIDAVVNNGGKDLLLDFSNIYLQADVVLVTQSSSNYIRGLQYLGNQRVGAAKGYAIEHFLKNNYPKLNYTFYENTEKGLKALSNSAIDIFVVDIPNFEFYSKKLSLTNLKISGSTDFVLKLRFGVKKENKVLVGILNKSLAMISQQEKNKIYNNWVSIKEPLIDYSLLWKFMLAGFIFFSIIVYWNRRLSYEVSLRKQAEKKAVKASQAKSDFLANMSHEIRTPMNSILGFAELLDNMVMDQEQKSYIKSIRSGGKALLSIINDILDLSKVEAGKMILKPEPVSLKHIIDEIDKLFINKITQKNLNFKVDLSEDFPEYILIDSVRLKQVIINLMENAVKFTEKGEIILSVELDNINLDTNNIDFSVSIEDTGNGIPSDQLESIFYKFEQRKEQDHTKYGGTGLGLSICKSLIKLMGGDICVSSVLEKGSIFKLLFKDIPLTESYADILDIGNIIDRIFQRSKVLVVDDVQDNRNLIEQSLNPNNLEILKAKNGKEALQIIYSESVDLILLDLRMPIMNGYETVTVLKGDDMVKDIPVIAFTASVMGEDLDKIQQYGFDGYLRKPVSKLDLIRVISEFIPYKESLEKYKIKNHIELSIEFTGDIYQFIEIYSESFEEEWERIKDKGDFELIYKFAVKLKKVGEDLKMKDITIFSEFLMIFIDSFDIIEVDKMMRKFPKIIQEFKQYIKNGEDNGE